jgi:hypothetical protein
VSRSRTFVQNRLRRAIVPAVMCVAGLACGACGKKGPPLAPFVGLPAAVEGMTAARLGNEVYLTLALPEVNVDRSVPVDLAYVDIYAYTGMTAPPRLTFVDQATRLMRIPVEPPAAPDAPVPAPETTNPAAGASVTVRDTLPDQVEPGTRRFYLAVPFSTRDRPGSQHIPVEVPLSPVPPAPAGIGVSHTATSVTITWTAPPAPSSPSAAPTTPAAQPGVPAPAAPVPAAPAPAVPAPVVPAPTAPGPPMPAAPAAATPPVATGVNIYLAPAQVDARATPPWQVARPLPLNDAPVAAPPFTSPVVFEVEACYQLRSVVGQGAAAVEGPASPPTCITPIDTFPPAAPVQLVAVATAGAINLLWEANAEPDLAGYIVLRGAVGDASLQPLNQMPTTEVRFVDMTVVSGMRYVYAVVAVDRRSPVPNISPESSRVEETAQ